MKDLKLITILITLLVFSLFLNKNQNNTLKTGDIAFTGFDASINDGFSFIALVDLKPKSTIYFTDSEWNGTHFGADESNLTWKSGEKTITKGTIVTLKNIKKKPNTNHGTIKNTMKLSKNKEALFAYVGDAPKLPSVFLAAVANSKSSYGTLINTGLEEGKTAITYPKGTYLATFNKNIYYTDKGFLMSLNNMNNYKLNTLLNHRLANNN